MINVAVEGESDREAAAAIVRYAGRTVARVIVAGGKSKLDPKISKYNEAARRTNWVVFRDSDGECPVHLRQKLTSEILLWSPRFSLRIAHSMTETWLLADHDGFAEFFRVRSGVLPQNPESLAHAKHTLLAICASSKSRSIRSDVVSTDGQTGPLYVARLNEFASARWNVEAAAGRSPSLLRAIRCIESLP